MEVLESHGAPRGCLLQAVVDLIGGLALADGTLSLRVMCREARPVAAASGHAAGAFPRALVPDVAALGVDAAREYLLGYLTLHEASECLERERDGGRFAPPAAEVAALLARAEAAWAPPTAAAAAALAEEGVVRAARAALGMRLSLLRYQVRCMVRCTRSALNAPPPRLSHVNPRSRPSRRYTGRGFTARGAKCWQRRLGDTFILASFII
jgi:hypothetical protein